MKVNILGMKKDRFFFYKKTVLPINLIIIQMRKLFK